MTERAGGLDIRATTILAVRRDGKVALAGDGQVTMPKRSKSWCAMCAEIISIAQHAKPKPIGQSDDCLAQFRILSKLVVMILSSNRCSINPMLDSPLGLPTKH